MQREDAEPSVRLPEDDTEPAQLIAAEQIRAQYGNMPSALAGNAIFATLLAVTLCNQLRPGVVAGWLAAAYASSCLRYALWRSFRRSRPALEDLPRWGRRFTLSAAIAGLVWGAGGIVLHVHGSFTQQILVLLVIVGMALMAMLIAASSLSAFIAFTYPVLLLFAVPYLMAGDPGSVTIGSTILLLLPIMTRLASRLSRDLRQSLQIRQRNAQLFNELRAQKKAAEEANIAKSRFIAIASHDLRQPLHALNLFVQALQECPLPAPERQLVVNIRRSVDAMEGLFDALQDISRLDAGVVRARQRSFALEELFERLRFEASAVAQEKGLRFTIARTSLHARSDPELLTQILRNLLTNAMRYTDRGGVLLGCRRWGERVRIEVWDTGCGIPDEQRALVFQEFTQLGNPERDRRKGLGLGLAIVERLTRLLGHEIELKSRVGKGSVFAVILPRARPQERLPALEPDSAAGSGFDLRGVLALILDPELSSRLALETMLRKWSCEVIGASSGAEVVEKLTGVRRAPDIIIADYQLREEANGVALIEQLRGEMSAEVPAVLITASTPAQRRDCEASGVPVLAKPVNPARLRTLLAHVAARPAIRTRRAS